MTRRLDVEKRREWEDRFKRFGASGLTVARFCANESVSEQTFYYWAKRIGRSSAVVRSTTARSNAVRMTTARSAVRDGTSERHREPVRRRLVSAATVNSPLVQFRLNAGIEVSVPADCLDVIRCLVNSVQSSHAKRADAFHEVVVGSR
ncbi:MAG: hypothetical protein WAN65_20135 [Candidatus Sulfotelmatobacter sp.]